MTNWEKIVGSVDVGELQTFARGATYREISKAASFTDGAGEVRKLLRRNGIKKARELTRKALNRRHLI